MPKQFLHSADSINPFQEMGRKGMSQDVATHLFGQSNLYGCILNSSLQSIFMDMMPTYLSTSRFH